MATEWYLIRPPYSQISGFEEEALEDFGQEAFLEVADAAGDDVELYNYDLSECTKVRAIIENKTPDTKLQSLTRQILLPIGTCKAGMYVKYKDKYWLIVGNVDDDKVSEKGVMVLCNYLLTWVTQDGRIVQRWANCISASQYNNGETGQQFYFVRSDQLLISIPDDDDSIQIDNGHRFVIDKRCRVYERDFQDGITCNTSKPLSVYELTRSDSVLYDYQDSGHFEFIGYQDEQRDSDGYYVIDGVGYWLCDEPPKESKGGVPSSEILTDSDGLYCGVEPAIYTAKFYDETGLPVDVQPEWTIDCNYLDELEVAYADASIVISTSNRKLIGKTFTVSLSADGYNTISIDVEILAFL